MPPAIFLLLIIKQIAQQVLYFWVCGQHEGILIVYLCQCFFSFGISCSLYVVFFRNVLQKVAL